MTDFDPGLVVNGAGLASAAKVRRAAPSDEAEATPNDLTRLDARGMTAELKIA